MVEIRNTLKDVYIYIKNYYKYLITCLILSILLGQFFYLYFNINEYSVDIILEIDFPTKIETEYGSYTNPYSSNKDINVLLNSTSYVEKITENINLNNGLTAITSNIINDQISISVKSRIKDDIKKIESNVLTLTPNLLDYFVDKQLISQIMVILNTENINLQKQIDSINEITPIYENRLSTIDKFYNNTSQLNPLYSAILTQIELKQLNILENEYYINKNLDSIKRLENDIVFYSSFDHYSSYIDSIKFRHDSFKNLKLKSTNLVESKLFVQNSIIIMSIVLGILSGIFFANLSVVLKKIKNSNK